MGIWGIPVDSGVAGDAMATGTDRPQMDLALKATNPGLACGHCAMLRSGRMAAAAVASPSAGSASSDRAVAARDRVLEAAGTAAQVDPTALEACLGNVMNGRTT